MNASLGPVFILPAALLPAACPASRAAPARALPTLQRTPPDARNQLSTQLDRAAAVASARQQVGRRAARVPGFGGGPN